MPWATNTVTGLQYWVNWTSTLTNPSNTVSPTSALINSTLKNSFLPPFLLIFTCLLYIVFVIAYSQSPGNGKLAGIAFLVMVISLIESAFGLIGNAIIGIMVFFVALMLSLLFKSG